VDLEAKEKVSSYIIFFDYLRESKQAVYTSTAAGKEQAGGNLYLSAL
jgi:hypothetical protein